MATFDPLLRLINAHDNRQGLADSYSEELHFQSSRVVVFASIASVVWLLYVPVDKALHPDQQVIVTLRWMLVVTGAITLTLFQIRRFRQHSQYLLLIWGGYLLLAAATISGLTGNDKLNAPYIKSIWSIRLP